MCGDVLSIILDDNRSTHIVAHGQLAGCFDWFNNAQSNAVTRGGVQVGSTCGLHAFNHLLYAYDQSLATTRRTFESIALQGASGDRASNLVQAGGGSNYDVFVLTKNFQQRRMSCWPMTAADLEGSDGLCFVWSYCALSPQPLCVQTRPETCGALCNGIALGWYRKKSLSFCAPSLSVLATCSCRRSYVRYTSVLPVSSQPSQSAIAHQGAFQMCARRHLAGRCHAHISNSVGLCISCCPFELLGSVVGCRYQPSLPHVRSMRIRL